MKGNTRIPLLSELLTFLHSIYFLFISSSRFSLARTLYLSVGGPPCLLKIWYDSVVMRIRSKQLRIVEDRPQVAAAALATLAEAEEEACDIAEEAHRPTVMYVLRSRETALCLSHLGQGHNSPKESTNRRTSFSFNGDKKNNRQRCSA